MYCPECGRDNPDQARYCGECGTALPSPKPLQYPTEPPTDGGKPKKHRSLIRVIIVLAGVLIILLAVTVLLRLFRGGSTDEDAADGSEAAESSYERDESLVAVGSGNMNLLDLSGMELTAADSDEALTVLDSLTGVLPIDSASEELVLKNESSFSGSAYYRFQQMYNGLTVVGCSVVLAADADGSVQLLTENLSDMSGAVEEALIDESDAIEIALAWLETEASEEGDEDYESPETTANELCYYVSDTEGIVLSYAVSAADSTVYVSAVTGSVLDTAESTSGLTGYNSDGSIEVPVGQTDEGTYYLYDEERDLNVFTWGGASSIKDESVPSSLYSENLYFGDTEEEDALEYETGIAWYQMLCSIYDFYLNNFNEHGFGGIILCYNDGADYGQNARGGYRIVEDENGITEEYNYLSIGSAWNNVIEECADVMAHEFTHAITKAVIGTDFPNGGESGALNEGFSDIMGVLIEAEMAGDDPDWTIEFEYGSFLFDVLAYNGDENRYAYDPVILNYNDYEESLDSHDAGTLIFHCAYLMWNGYTEENSNVINPYNLEAIDDVETLAELWYRTILLLNSDATFSDCRTACEAAAALMNKLGLLSDSQVDTVIWAFDAAGIPASSGGTVTRLDSTSSVNIYDVNGNLTDEYAMVITDLDGTEIASYSGEENGSSVELSLSDGYYLITVSSTEANYSAEVYPVVIMTESSYFPSNIEKTSELNIYTTFGTSLSGQVTDEDDSALEYVLVTAVPAEIGVVEMTTLAEEAGWEMSELVKILQDADSDTAYETETDEDGDWRLYLPVGIYDVTYELDGYESVTVRQIVKAGSNETDFVELIEILEWLELDSLLDDFEAFYDAVGGSYSDETGDFENWILADGIEYGNYADSSAVDELTVYEEGYELFGIRVGLYQEDAEDQMADWELIDSWEDEGDEYLRYASEDQNLGIYISDGYVIDFTFWRDSDGEEDEDDWYDEEDEDDWYDDEEYDNDDALAEEAYALYVAAYEKRTASGQWYEEMSAYIYAVATYKSQTESEDWSIWTEAYVSGYDTADPSGMLITGSGSMDLGTKYAWTYTYSDGVISMVYTKPYSATAQEESDPSIYSGYALTADMMTDVSIDGNTISFWISGDHLEELGLAALESVDLTDSVEDYSFSDVYVVVSVDDSGMLEQIYMEYELTFGVAGYSGAEAYADYTIYYNFSDYV